MAKVAGKDVLIDLIDSVNQLKTSQARLEENFERMSARLELMAERSAATSMKLEQVSSRMEQLSSTVEQLSSTVKQTVTDIGFLSRAFREMSNDQTAMQADFVRMAGTTRESQAVLKHMATVLTNSITSTDERFEKIEARLTKVEKKTGS